MRGTTSSHSLAKHVSLAIDICETRLTYEYLANEEQVDERCGRSLSCDEAPVFATTARELTFVRVGNWFDVRVNVIMGAEILP